MKKIFCTILLSLFIMENTSSQIGVNLTKDDLLNEEIAFLTFLKTQNSTQLFAEEYLARFDRKTLEYINEDEFAYREKIESIKKNLQSKINAIDSSKVYYIPAIIDFGKYNFEEEFIPLTISEDSYFPIMRKEIFEVGKFSKFKKTKLDICFSNGKNFQKLYLDKEEARRLISSKKDKNNGDVDRKIYGLLKFKIDFEETHNTNLSVKNNANKIVGIIDNIKFYADKNFSIPIFGRSFSSH